MEKILSEAEARVLGALIEKQITTPAYYPLTLNALVNACNQSSNRDPVVAFDEQTVLNAIDALRAKNLAYVFYGSESRVPKYKHCAPEVFHLSPQEVALMCLLLLRGPQTPGELRGRSGRLYDFSSVAEVEQTLRDLAARDDPAFVVALPRQPGQKEVRYSHLLSGATALQAYEKTAVSVSKPRELNGSDRIAALEAEVERLRREVNGIRSELDAFKKQFE